ncbi:hypothetical protein [Dokdonella sp.]|uniref:hypothetical protein n=1 Tax=Dokdonella sp. TaxID=2291710 RepID=UPI003BAF14B1
MNRALTVACLLACYPCVLSAQALLPNLPESETAPIIFVPDATAISMGAVLQDRQVKELTDHAENGDCDAAFRLSRHYQAKNASLMERYWLLRAALGGHSIAQHWLWFALRNNKHCADMGEALAWLESSAKLGNMAAKDELNEYKRKVNICIPESH